MDGKTLRGIHGEEIPGVHLVAAFAHQTRVVLAQAETTGKGHELAGVEAVLAALPGQLLSVRVVTGDASLAHIPAATAAQSTEPRLVALNRPTTPASEASERDRAGVPLRPAP